MTSILVIIFIVLLCVCPYVVCNKNIIIIIIIIGKIYKKVQFKSFAMVLLCLAYC